MSSGTYRRATKNHAVQVEHTDGSISDGFLPVPLGMDYVGMLMQAQGFIQFVTSGGEDTFLNVSAIKRITSMQQEDDSQADHNARAERARADKEAQREQERAEEEAAREEAERRKHQAKSKVSWTGDEYDALEVLGLKSSATRSEIQIAYRKLVKLYHPDRLRGLGVSAKKIEFAAQRLSEINSSYRILMASQAAAA